MDIPPSLDPLRIRKALGRSRWAPAIPFGPGGWLFDSATDNGRILVTCADLDDGTDWVHASMSWHDRTPSYDELKLLHQAVFADGWSYQVFTPPASHVNIHSYALHLWGRLDGKPALPDFAAGIGSI